MSGDSRQNSCRDRCSFQALRAKSIRVIDIAIVKVKLRCFVNLSTGRPGQQSGKSLAIAICD